MALIGSKKPGGVFSAGDLPFSQRRRMRMRQGQGQGQGFGLPSEAQVVDALRGYADRRSVEALNQRQDPFGVITAPIEYGFGQVAGGIADQFGNIKQAVQDLGSITPQQNAELMMGMPFLGGSVPEGALAANALIRSGKYPKLSPEYVDQIVARHAAHNSEEADRVLEQLAQSQPRLSNQTGADIRFTSRSMLEDMEEVPRFNNQRELAAYLDERYRAMGGTPLTEYTPENMEIIAQRMAEEAIAAYSKAGNAAEWYQEKVGNAMKMAQEVYPELADSPGANSAFRIGLALTSNGASVPDNSDMAFKVYDFFSKNGRMPTSKDMQFAGTSGPTVSKAFELYNELLGKLGGTEEVSRFLDSEMTVRELREVMGNKSLAGGENVDTRVKGSAIFGSKIGQGFYQNLNGNWDELTADRWFMRTWGRLTGQNRKKVSAETFSDQRATLLEAARNTKNLKKKYGVTFTDLKNSDDLLLDFAEQRFKEYSRGGYKDKTSLNKASKNIIEALNKTLEHPNDLASPGTARNFMRATGNRVLEMLREQGIDMNMASLQAIVWYPEKDLYEKMGGGSSKAAPTDYETEFARVVQSRGIPLERISQIIGGDNAAPTGQGRDRADGPGRQSDNRSSLGGNEGGPGGGQAPVAGSDAAFRQGVRADLERALLNPRGGV